MEELFSGLEPYKLTSVRVTDRELGHGSYATVLELEYMGLKCAGKKIHRVLQNHEDTITYAVDRFEKECCLLSQIRHPNIVQFLGVYFHEQGVQVPILVMELLHTNLTSCIDNYGILPKEITYLILHDVALGLCYLHCQTPAIIHRDLSSNNVLLTTNMTAKISDLGVAKILNLTPLQVSHMTKTPGTPSYMPPEAMIAKPTYNTSIDEFSYGILMIHSLSGQWPEPQVEPNKMEDGKLIPVTEAERRQIFLQIIGKDHPLMDLILKCLNNDPASRAHSIEIVEHLSKMALQFPVSFANRLDMLKRIEADKLELHQREKQMLGWKKEAEKKTEEVNQMNVAHSCEVKQLKLQLKDMASQNELFVEETEAELTELKTKVALYEAQAESGDKIQQESEQSDVQLTNEMEILDSSETQENEESVVKLNRVFTKKIHDLRSEVSRTRTKANALQHRLEADIAIRDGAIKRSETELKARTRVLQTKDSIISGMTEQLTKAREHLVTKQQVWRS